ncbi:UDP-glucuronosyltransferase-like [Eucyclogobius newberryi]|uniref:UDP-glucuronosyltransferase-like n=1 Tax=Eucyclogobius newberryi TaxID=166745 RepID=UPI003B5AD32D
MEAYLVLGLLLCLSVGLSDGGKLLAVPVDGSHWLSMKILVKELVVRGHEVVVLVPETSLLIKNSQSYSTIMYKVPYTKEQLDGKFKELRAGIFSPPKFSDLMENINRLVNFTTMQAEGCEHLLQNQALMDHLKGEGFEALLTDPFLPCGSILARMFSIPAVYFLRGLPCQLDTRANQCPSPPSFVPVAFSDNTDKMNFLQRVKNTLVYSFETYICTVLYAKFDDLVSRYIEKDMSYQTLLGEGAIWLLRNDFTFEWPRPIMPNMVFIGGINCAKKAPLPADLKEFVEGSGDDGFIVFTMGSMVSNMPIEIATLFFEAFGQMPQRVLWRYEGEVPANAPKNVKLLKWLPQNDLLAHPKARVFMTHGGTHGLYEGICNGVPMLMFPLFGDQRDNVHRMVARGVAEQLLIYDLSTEAIVTALRKLINDESYHKKIQTLSELHKDRPMPPLDLAVFWTEFVMRHKGADHLRVAAHDLNWIQYFCLDVLAFLGLIVTTVVWLTVKCCLFCTRKCCGRGTVKNKQA